MKRLFVLFMTVLLFLFAGFSESPATVEWDILQTLKIEKNPRDVLMSLSGKWIYVLTDDGELLIYAPNGEVVDRISVGKTVDGIKAGPREGILLLTSRKDATVQIITIDFIQTINTEGS
ncbi:YncE family protein, partial [Thermodesulfobacteriota bacterium]